VVLELELAAGLTTARALQELPAPPSIPKTSEPKPDVRAAARELSMFLALPLMPKTPEQKLDVRVAAAQALSVFSALPLMPKTPEPILDAQVSTALQPPRQGPQLAELQPAFQVSYPRPGRAVQEPSPHPPSRWIAQDPTVHTALKTPHRRHPRK
jgi:hypothetical protein